MGLEFKISIKRDRYCNAGDGQYTYRDPVVTHTVVYDTYEAATFGRMLTVKEASTYLNLAFANVLPQTTESLDKAWYSKNMSQTTFKTGDKVIHTRIRPDTPTTPQGPCTVVKVNLGGSTTDVDFSDGHGTRVVFTSNLRLVSQAKTAEQVLDELNHLTNPITVKTTNASWNPMCFSVTTPATKDKQFYGMTLAEAAQKAIDQITLDRKPKASPAEKFSQALSLLNSAEQDLRSRGHDFAANRLKTSISELKAA